MMCWPWFILLLGGMSPPSLFAPRSILFSMPFPVLVLIAVLIGGFLYWRSRKGGLKGLPLSNHGSMRLNENEESIPLRAHGDGEDHDGSSTLVGHDDEVRSRGGKGKGKEGEP